MTRLGLSGLSLGFSRPSSAAAATAPAAMMAGTNRGQSEGYTGQVPVSAPGPFTRGEFRNRFYTGRYPLTNPRPVIPNWGVSTGDQPGPNAISAECVYEAASPSAATRWLFSGSNTALIPVGDNGVADALSITIPANTLFYVREGITVASGETYYYGAFSDGPNCFSNAATSQINGTGGLTLPSGGSQINFAYGHMPLAIVGQLPAGAWSVALFGDSISQGVSESQDAYGNNSHLAKGLQEVTGGMVPNSVYAKSGEFMSTFNGSGGLKRRGMMAYHNAAIFGFGANDLSGVVTLQQMKDRYLAMWADARSRGILKIGQCNLIPRQNSHTTTTPYNTAYSDGNLRDQLNAWFPTMVGNSLGFDYLLDMASLVEDAADHTKFNPLYDADGTHPSEAGGQKMKLRATQFGEWLLFGVAGQAPYKVVAPSITGAAQDGQTLTGVIGTFEGTHTIGYTFQWKADGTNISGATAQTCLLTSAEVGKTPTFVVTATNSAGSVTETSAGVGPVASSSTNDMINGQIITNNSITSRTVPAGITSIAIEIWGGGGVGGTNGSFGGGGSSSGAYCKRNTKAVTPGQSITFAIAAAQNTANQSGNATTCDGMTAGGGIKGQNGARGVASSASGGDVNTAGGLGSNGSGAASGFGGTAPGTGGGAGGIHNANGSAPGGGGGGGGIDGAIGLGAAGGIRFSW